MQQRTGLILSGALLAFGLVGALTLLFKGHGIMGTSHQFPWGIMISAYVFFALIGSGLCLITSIGGFFAIKPFASLARRSVVLSLITLSSAFIIMGLETPQPFNMIYMLFSPNFSSAIFWMGSLYGVYLVFLLSEFWHLIIKNNPTKAHRFATFAFFSALAASSNLGAVFGYIHARPLWEGAFMPVFFVLTALLSGSAALIVLYFLLERKTAPSLVLPATGKFLGLFLITTLFFSIWKLITGLYGNIPAKADAYRVLFSGPYAFHFWGLEIGVGLMIPLVLLFYKQTRAKTFAAALLSLVGLFFMRYNLVIGGLIIPLDVIDQLPLPVSYLSYSPSWVELSIVCLGFGFTGLMYLLAEKRFDLSTSSSDLAVADHKMSATEVVQP